MKQQGYHTVSNGHQLYYEVFGNPDGIPLVFLHGGPGIGFSDADKKMFDVEKFRLLFFEQRGASRSKPYGSIENNTTDLLIADINALTNRFQFDKFVVFGGSWGSTLALVYAIRNPNRVLKLIVRGIFLANKEAINYYINGGVKLFFPEVWGRFKAMVPKNISQEIAVYYYNMMCSKDEKIAKKFATEWARYEIAIYKMELTESQVNEILKTIPTVSLAKLEAHYMANNCFLTEDYILNNTAILKDIPITIIQGRYDVICPPIFAYKLHQKLQNSTLSIVHAGHAASEPAIYKALVTVLNDLKIKS